MTTSPFLATALAAVLALAPAPSSRADDPPAFDRIAPEDFDARAAEHLLNRAGFGGTPAEVARLVELGPEAAVVGLFEPRSAVPAFAVGPGFDDLRAEMRGEIRDRLREEGLASRGELDEEGRELVRDALLDVRRQDRRQMFEYTAWWIERMVRGDDPLRDRMTLFWAGLFTSSYQDVRDSVRMIAQHRTLRAGALGSYADLVVAVARDPAMLRYLDNGSNVRTSPNENFARELLELFTLGEGHYTEADVVAAARAFTGWTDRGGEFDFVRRQHDFDEKTFLGVTGRLGGMDVLEILLDQDRCAEYVAGRVLRYFEGRPADPERAARYGALLRAVDYELRPLLEALFLDPEFYSDEVVGQRIAGPVDYLVGHARRLGLEPPPALIAFGAGSVGQALFQPPSVKGWDGDRAWITTTTIMQRGNLAGVLVGTVGAEEFLATGDLGAPDDGSDGEMGGPTTGAPLDPVRGGGAMERVLGRLEDAGWRPRLRLSRRIADARPQTDAAAVEALADELLAVPLTVATKGELVAFLAAERASKSLPVDVWSRDPREGEALARRLAHLLLSLPEGQLH